MSAVTNTGYQDLRDYIQANWVYIELRDNTGTPIMRIPESDTRVTWTHSAGAQVMELTTIIKGSDADVTLPKTFAQAAIFKVASGGTALSSEAFTPFTMEASTDQLTLTYRIEVPEVV